MSTNLTKNIKSKVSASLGLYSGFSTIVLEAVYMEASYASARACHFTEI